MKKKIIIGFVIIFFIFSALLLYSRYISTSGLIIKEYKVINKKVPDNFHGLKVVHLTDIHFGRTINEKEINKIKDSVNVLNPDIIVLTGDLFDRNRILSNTEQKIITEALKGMKAKLGKYGIMGNHDFKNDYFTAILSNSGFSNLNNKFELIYDKTNTPIIIAGINSNIEDKTPIIKKIENLTTYLDENKDMNDIYKILLIHEPDYLDEFDYSLFDLALAGHSHGGQVRFPLIGATVLPVGGKKYYEDYYRLNKTDLFVSSGLGTATIDFRFLNKPSFNFYRITNK